MEVRVKKDRKYKGGAEGSHGMNKSSNTSGISHGSPGNVKSTYGRGGGKPSQGGGKGGNRRTTKEGDTYK